ncbi:hypothetical protein BX616_003598 [Lobosporangium transversale]|uniref:Uncharacterized protein n=1 Tax=Lobosporangium transversale TaxID=64571 RepID=A0A1Y2GIJ8_9FUNG|nr:hypothetical protein BCR41DRAFT_423260 [Lobosporangium transversale]KAF9898794.1 hypothetical protein BX616_003598 [Lobosporangium transversale]ORZ12065.1 hypothetical protein BCR41DRAFT_423260 [Lobosporangium transversale]|eukprot:XP_021879930.1 hypothetical protein BCR41DRAFT_423260 [Lobosporangium transversale]
MVQLAPVCFTSDEAHIYAATFGRNLYAPRANGQIQTQQNIDLLILRSNPYPTSLEGLNWTVISKTKSYLSEALYELSFKFRYTCSLNPWSYKFLLSAQTVLTNDTPIYQFNTELYLDSTGFADFAVPEQRLLVPQDELFQGRSLILPIQHESPSAWNLDWLKIRPNGTLGTIVFTYYMKARFPFKSQVNWSMRPLNIGDPIAVSYVNNTLYATFYSIEDRQVTLAAMPLDPVNIFPDPPPAQIIKTNIGQECAITDLGTTMHAYQGSFYFICEDLLSTLLRIYIFDGTSMQYLGSIPFLGGHLPNFKPMFQFIPVPQKSQESRPNNNSTTTAAKRASWIYMYSFKDQGYALNLSDSNWGYHLEQFKDVYTDDEYVRLVPQSFEGKKPDAHQLALIISLTCGAVVLLLLGVMAKKIYRRKRRGTGSREEQGQSPPSTALSHPVGVHRTLHGEDACDMPPSYNAQGTMPSSLERSDIELATMPPTYHEATSST